MIDTLQNHSIISLQYVATTLSQLFGNKINYKNLMFIDWQLHYFAKHDIKWAHSNSLEDYIKTLLRFGDFYKYVEQTPMRWHA
jgi:hypothetical protein